MKEQAKSPLKIGFFLVLIMGLSLLSFVSASDTLPPTIYKIWTDKASVFDDESVLIYVNASDDLSGMDSIYLSFRSNSGQQADGWAHYENEEEGIYSISIYFPAFSENGIWKLYTIQAVDNVNNRVDLFEDAYHKQISDYGLNVLEINLTSSNFYLRCPSDFSKILAVKNSTETFSISPNNDRKLDSFQIIYSTFMNPVNYTFTILDNNYAIVFQSTKNNVDILNETWNGNYPDGSIKEGVYRILVELEDGSGSELYTLGNINIAFSPTDYSVSLSNNTLIFNEIDDDRSNNITLNISSGSPILWNVSLLHNDDSRTWFSSYSQNFSISSYFVKNDNLKFRTEYRSSNSCIPDMSSFVLKEINVCSEGEESFSCGYAGSGYGFSLSENSTSIKIILEGIDIAGNKIERREIPLTFKSNITSTQNCDLNNLQLNNINVHRITPVNQFAIANNQYADGWKYNFFITVPTNETKLTFRMNDWLGNNQANRILTFGNTVINFNNVQYSVGSNYGNSQSFVVSDENPYCAGIQTSFDVLIKLPIDTIADSYSTSYSIKSEQN